MYNEYINKKLLLFDYLVSFNRFYWFLFIDVVMTIGFFSFILGTQDYKTKGLNVYLLDLTNLGKTNIVLGLAVSLILFSMIGLPPLAGFFGKMYLFFAAMNSNL